MPDDGPPIRVSSATAIASACARSPWLPPTLGFTTVLERYAIPFLGAKRLTAIRRDDVRDWVAWLVDDAAQARRHADENAPGSPPAPWRCARPARFAIEPWRGSSPWSKRPSPPP